MYERSKITNHYLANETCPTQLDVQSSLLPVVELSERSFILQAQVFSPESASTTGARRKRLGVCVYACTCVCAVRVRGRAFVYKRIYAYTYALVCPSH